MKGTENNANTVTMEDIRGSLAKELLAWEEESALPETETASDPSAEESGRERGEKKRPLFGTVAGLFSMDEELDALKEAVKVMERELAELREDFEEERTRNRRAEETLRNENSRLLSELAQLRETDETIHMRVFDNRVRIGELREELELRKEQRPGLEREAEESEEI